MVAFNAKTKYQGHAVNGMTAAIYVVMNILVRLKAFGGETSDITMVQGGYNKGGVAASAGTHDGGGADDATPYNWKFRVRLFRLLGNARYHRTRIVGLWEEHIHGVNDYDATASRGAKAQVVDYHNRLDALADRRKDTDYRMLVFPRFLGVNIRTVYATVLAHSYEQQTSASKLLRTIPTGTAISIVASTEVAGKEWYVTAQADCIYAPHFTTTKPAPGKQTETVTTPPVTKPSVTPPRPAGVAPTKLPSTMAKMFHVPAGTPYPVEDSVPGLELALAKHYPWTDFDLHITKDGVLVGGHDTSPSDDGFIIPADVKAKYGSHPNIENMPWSVVSKLRTKTGLRYYTLEEVTVWMAAHTGLSVALELKQSKPFELASTFENIRDLAAKYGVDQKRLAIMSIARGEYNHLARFKAAHDAGFVTIILPHGLVKPSNWVQVQRFVDHYRGSWK